MQFNPSTSDQEIISQIQLLKSCLFRKSSLYSEINLMKIKKSYAQSNLEYRDSKEALGVCKSLNKRLSEIRQILNFIKKGLSSSGSTSQSNFDQIKFLKEETLDLPRHIFSMNFQQETYIDSLKDHYEELCLAYDEKIELCKRQDTLINDNDKLADQHELLVSEVADLQGKVQNLQHSKAIMEGIKAKKNMKRKLSFHNMKVYHQLSDNALKLQSRLSMKNELIKNLKIAEKEVEGLRKRIENSQQKIKLLKQEVKVQESYSKQHEPELMQLNHMFQKLNIRLYALYQEKDDLLELLSADVQDAQDLDYEEDETVQIPDWSSRISEIKKEKDLISEENRRLKEKISKWNFSP